jgi:alpha-glucosidase
MKMALLCALRGNIIIYNGEELGLDQVDIPFELIKDPEALKNWPLTLSRDGARTPLPWEGGTAHAGFSSAEPWLPLGAAHAALAVDRQEDDPASLLHLTRRLVALRAGYPALRAGDNRNWITEGDLLAFDRIARDDHLRCLFNLGNGTIDISGHAGVGTPVVALNGATIDCLPPCGALWLNVQGDM